MKKLAKMRREEESKWVQRAKVKHVQEGGNNTKYFHLIANGKHRRKQIFQLEQDEGTIVGDENLRIFISEYYKKLFGPQVQNSFSLYNDANSDIPQVSSEENVMLTADFTEEEVFEAISQMEHNKAPGPDGFLLNSIKFSGTLLRVILWLCLHSCNKVSCRCTN
jgi:hypothetical protein